MGSYIVLKNQTEFLIFQKGKLSYFTKLLRKLSHFKKVDIETYVVWKDQMGTFIFQKGYALAFIQQEAQKEAYISQKTLTELSYLKKSLIEQQANRVFAMSKIACLVFKTTYQHFLKSKFDAKLNLFCDNNRNFYEFSANFSKNIYSLMLPCLRLPTFATVLLHTEIVDIC